MISFWTGDAFAFIWRSNEEFGVSFNATGLAHAITVDELPEEIRKVVTAIEKSSKFS